MKRYVIVNIADVTQEIMDMSTSVDLETARISNDGLKVVLTFENGVPVELTKNGYISLWNGKIKEALRDSNWQEAEI